MKVLALVFAVMLLIPASLCRAEGVSLKEAYSIYYKGEKEKAIGMVEEYVQDNPDAGAFYFLGYAYYEMQNMDKANEYFNEAFRLKDFYSPIPQEE